MYEVNKYIHNISQLSYFKKCFIHYGKRKDFSDLAKCLAKFKKKSISIIKISVGISICIYISIDNAKSTKYKLLQVKLTVVHTNCYIQVHALCNLKDTQFLLLTLTDPPSILYGLFYSNDLFSDRLTIALHCEPEDLNMSTNFCRKITMYIISNKPASLSRRSDFTQQQYCQ